MTYHDTDSRTNGRHASGHRTGVTILDCTLRDGGHNTLWHFDHTLVLDYLAAVAQTAVDIVELGYRTRTYDPSCGAYRLCSSDLLRSHPVDSGLAVAVMVDAQPLLQSRTTPGDLDALFGPREHSPITMVRVATTLDTLEAAVPLCTHIKRLGYELSVNLMQVSRWRQRNLPVVASLVRDTAADVVYLADSFGGLTPPTTRALVGEMVAACACAVGFHAHDNIGLALANTIAAIDEGATFVDCSVLGMGRGAGNTRSEQLLAYLATSARPDATVQPLFDLIGEHFVPLHARYPWGATIPNLVAGISEIHPRYVSELQQLPELSERTRLAILSTLRLHEGRAAFRTEVLAQALADHGVEPCLVGHAGARSE